MVARVSCVQRKHAMVTLCALCTTADGVSRVLSCSHVGEALVAAMSQMQCNQLREEAIATVLHVVLPAAGGVAGKNTTDAGVTVRGVGLLQVTGIVGIAAAMAAALECAATSSVWAWRRISTKGARARGATGRDGSNARDAARGSGNGTLALSSWCAVRSVR